MANQQIFFGCRKDRCACCIRSMYLASLGYVDAALLQYLEIEAVLIEPRDVAATAANPLLGDENVRQHQLTELRLTDEPAVSVGIGRLDLYFDVDAAQRITIRGVAL